MDKLLSRDVSVIIECRPAVSRWIDEVWRPVEVLDGAASAELFTELARDADGAARYFAGNGEIVLYRDETDAYRRNLAGDRVIYVVMRPERSRPPYSLHLVTVSPHEALEYLDAGEELVEAVPMPQVIAEWVTKFCSVHHVDTPFVKRKRGRAATEQLKFSKEPIFARSGRFPTAGEEDDDD